MMNLLIMLEVFESVERGKNVAKMHKLRYISRHRVSFRIFEVAEYGHKLV